MRNFRSALGFLTRFPASSAATDADLSRAAPWFPVIGALIGIIVSLVLFLAREQSDLLAATLGVTAWVALTGALHLDGLADTSDALAASHGHRDRLFAVLGDPHVGTFAVASIVLVLLVKTASLAQLTESGLVALPLTFAWARLGPLYWAHWLKPLKEGSGQRFAKALSKPWIFLWTFALLLASATCKPWLCVAPLVLAAWAVWLRLRLGGFNGDCLGAGVEVCETALVALLALTGGGLSWRP